MSQQFQPAKDNPSTSGDLTHNERARVYEFIDRQKSSDAVAFAKDLHKRYQSAASDALLLHAYCARLDALIDRNLERDALALIENLLERFPSWARALAEHRAGWNAKLAIPHGDLSALLGPLRNPSLSPEAQAAVYLRVRREIFDLHALADTPVLPPDHPLRTAAAALHRAFHAVTTGPVADDALLLPEVSRSSPLAPWKMLVRAIASSYRRDAGLCEKYLAAIDPDSVPARLVPALRTLLHNTQPLTPTAANLVNQVAGSLDLFRAALKRLDASFEHKNKTLILQEIRNAIDACRKADPPLLDRLRQHISVHAKMAGLKTDKVLAALGGPSRKDAYFWRLLARSEEESKGEAVAIAVACSYWEEFRKHASRQGWLPSTGPELAALYLHMADLLARLSPHDFNYVLSTFLQFFDHHRGFYEGQPPEIRALMPTRADRPYYYLSPLTVLQRACEADPTGENFQRLLLHSQQLEPSVSDEVAQAWIAALPSDIPPLLHLMHSAEKRNALQKAFKYMEQAEKIDGVNSDVRRARLRLLISIAHRHLREKKPKLAGKDLLLIEALPQSRQGDRPAFVAALRFVFSALQGDRKAADAAFAEASRLVADGHIAHGLIQMVESWCDCPGTAVGPAPPRTIPLFAYVGRVAAIGEEFIVLPSISPDLPPKMIEELSAPNVTADPRTLAALGECALLQDLFPLAYAVSRVGLQQAPDHRARFLFVRARSLPPWEADRRSACLGAAAELARHHHDSDLLKRIGEERAETLAWLDAPDAAKPALNAEGIAQIVEAEINQRAYPNSRPPNRSSLDDTCQCPTCRARRRRSGPDLDNDIFDDDDLDDDDLDEVFEGIPKNFVDFLETLGPEAIQSMLNEMVKPGGPGPGGPRTPRPKKRRRRARPNVDDLPF